MILSLFMERFPNVLMYWAPPWEQNTNHQIWPHLGCSIFSASDNQIEEHVVCQRIKYMKRYIYPPLESKGHIK